MAGVVLLSQIVAASALSAQGARLDPSFGRDGKVITKNTSGVGYPAIGIIEDRRGRLVAAGGADDKFVIARYRLNGQLDRSFGKRGKAYVGDWKPSITQDEHAYAGAVALQRDGKILAVGPLVLGENPNSGADCWALARLNPDGSLDRSFGGDRGRQLSCNLGDVPFAVAIQRDGKILVAGQRPKGGRRNVGGIKVGTIARLLPNGRLDRSFGPRKTGIVRFRAAPNRQAAGVLDLAVLPSGNILASGYFGNRFMLVRLRPDGDLDRRFGPPRADGRVITDVDGRCRRCAIGWGLARDRRGRILVTGYVGPTSPEDVERYVALARYRPNGRLDRTFGRRGIVRIRLGNYLTSRHVEVEPDGQIIVVGSSGPERTSRFTLLRFNSDGKRDPSFFANGVFAPRFGSQSGGRDVIIDRSDRIVASGFTLRGAPPANPGAFPPDWSFLVTRFRPAR